MSRPVVDRGLAAAGRDEADGTGPTAQPEMDDWECSAYRGQSKRGVKQMTTYTKYK